MPPSFKPKESRERKRESKDPRERKRETKEPEMPKPLEQQVKEIADRYRAEQKWKKRVDHWGQPLEKLDEGKLRRKLREAKWDAEKERPKGKEKGLLGKLADAAGRTGASERKKDGKGREDKDTSEKRDVKDTQKRESRETQKESAKPEPSKVNDSPKETKGRLGPKNHLRYGEVNGEKITTPKRLNELLNSEYEGLKRRKDFVKLKEDALAHMEMVKRYEGMERIPWGVTAWTAKELGRDSETVRQWTKGENAGLYRFMEYATPKSEASEKVQRILEANNGVKSPEDVRARYAMYYFEEAERNSKFFAREEAKMLKYFEFLERYKKGGTHLDIAKEVGLSDSGALAYLEGAKPWLVSVACQIPPEKPREGYKWLPRVGGTHAVRDDWIEVPEKITNWEQVKEVIDKMNCLQNKNMSRWAKKFEPWSNDESFMYLLGAYVSDSKVPSSSTIANAFGINQKKDNTWSKDFGEACCYALGKIGISAHRVSDNEPSVAEIKTPYGTKEIHSGPQYEWMSENSPFLKWMRKSCLGFDDTAKSYQAVDGEWILRSPERWRLAFLRGLSDGDGSTSKIGYYFSISTHSGHGFIGDLMRSFGSSVYQSETYVRTDGFDSLCNMAEVNPFKYAKERSDDLQKTKRMIDSRRHNIQSIPPTSSEIRFMISEHKKGLSFGRIGESLYDRYGYTLDARDIRRFILKHQKKKSERGS